MTGGPHPSYQRLDGLRLGALPAADATEVRGHVAACAHCAAHLAALTPGPRPAWLTGVKVTRARPRRLWLWPALGLVAAAGLLLVVRPRVDEPSGMRSKGAPALRVVVKRGDQMFVWDGHAAMQAGDRLRFEIDGGGFGHVSLAALHQGREPEVLYSGALAPGLGWLPPGFRIDGRDRQEVLSLVLGQRPLPARVHGAAGDAPADSELWRRVLVFPKQQTDVGSAATGVQPW